MTDEEWATNIMRLCGAHNEHARIAIITAAVRAEAALTEREACAKIAEDFDPTFENFRDGSGHVMRMVFMRDEAIAAAIRARGES